MSEDELHAQTKQAASSFLSEQLDKDSKLSVPKPPEISYEGLEIRPLKLDFISFGQQDSHSEPHGYGFPPPDPTGDPTGACCITGFCVELTADACAALGGTYMGDGTPCSPDPC